MKQFFGITMILILWLITANLVREYPFELKLPSMILMGFLTLFIAYFTNLTDKKNAKSSNNRYNW
jgi:uncharacterized protein YhhL (DUF1145 family)